MVTAARSRSRRERLLRFHTLRGLAPPASLALLAACGGGPPDALGGFELGLTQEQVLDAVRERGGFGCRLRATRPKLTVCEGPAEEGVVTVTVRDDSVTGVALRLDPADDEPRRAIRRFVRPFGDAAWRDRPRPPGSPQPADYHTLWVDGDTTLALAMTCAGPELEPPCTAELTETSPARVQAALDTLLGLRR